MRSLSDVLTKKREEMNLTVDQVSYETNISKKYIEALEQEDFEVFPAEAYLLGFLRNYAEFLDLEYESIYSEYKNCLLREEPTPLDELVGNKKNIEIKPWMIVAPVVVLVLALGIPPLVKVIGNQIEKRKEALRTNNVPGNQEYEITSDFKDIRTREGDLFYYQVGENKLSLFVKEVTSNIVVRETFRGSTKELTLKLGKEIVKTYIDNESRKHEVTILLKDIGGFSDNSGIIKIKKVVKEPTPNDILNVEVNDSNKSNESKIIMVRKRTTEPYTISINFEGDILFRYQQKGRELKENFYRKGYVLNLDVTRSLKIWTSNAGLTKLKINGEPLVLGKSGSVHVFTLRWIYYKDKDEYRLEYQKAY